MHIYMYTACMYCALVTAVFIRTKFVVYMFHSVLLWHNITKIIHCKYQGGSSHVQYPGTVYCSLERPSETKKKINLVKRLTDSGPEWLVAMNQAQVWWNMGDSIENLKSIAFSFIGDYPLMVQHNSLRPIAVFFISKRSCFYLILVIYLEQL
jgi:hypothetical protein